MIYPHGDITPVKGCEGELWSVLGSLSFPLPRNMFIWRLPSLPEEDGKGDDDEGDKKKVKLLLYSVIELDEERFTQLDSLGEPAYIVVPNKYHKMDAASYKERYPDAKVLCPKDGAGYFSKVLKCGVDGTSEVILRDICGIHSPAGLKDTFTETVLLLPLKGGDSALIFCDTMFNCTEPPPNPGLTGWLIMKVSGNIGPLGPTRLARWVLIKDTKALAGWIESLVPCEEVGKIKMIGVAHGHIITGHEECASSLTGAVNRLR